MKKIISILSFFLLLNTGSFAQVIEGDRMLDLLGKNVSDPLFQQLKQQESFFTDAWDSKFTIYISRNIDVINEIEFLNGKKRYSSTERYGYYKKLLPWSLTWDMRAADFEKIFGPAVLTSTAMNFSDYRYKGWKLRIFYENYVPVSISFAKDENSTQQTPPTKPVTKPVPPTTLQSGSPIKVDVNNATAQVNWPILRQIITSYPNLKPLAGKDSVDYIGQVYYSTPFKVEGFERTAIKRKKQSNQWYYEAFYKTTADSNQVRKIFIALLDGIKKVINENVGDDFIHVLVAKKHLSESPVNWIAGWTIYSQYKILPPGLNNMRITLMLSGMKDTFHNDRMEYTFKIYIADKDNGIDFFTWGDPK